MISEIIVVALIAFAGSLAGAGVTAFIARQKWPVERKATEYNAAANLTQSASQFIDDLRAEIDAQRESIEELKQENRVQAADLARLREDLMKHLALIHKLENEKDSLKRALEVERGKRRFEVRRLEACINELEAQNAQLRQENAELRAFYEKGMSNEQSTG